MPSFQEVRDGATWSRRGRRAVTRMIEQGSQTDLLRSGRLDLEGDRLCVVVEDDECLRDDLRQRTCRCVAEVSMGSKGGGGSGDQGWRAD